MTEKQSGLCSNPEASAATKRKKKKRDKEHWIDVGSPLLAAAGGESETERIKGTSVVVVDVNEEVVESQQSREAVESSPGTRKTGEDVVFCGRTQKKRKKSARSVSRYDAPHLVPPTSNDEARPLLEEPEPSSSSSSSSGFSSSCLSLGSVLYQALQTEDTALLESALETRDEALIRVSVESLSGSSALLLLRQLLKRVASKHQRVSELGVWFKHLLRAHARHLAGNGHDEVEELYCYVVRRLQTHSSLVKLQAKVETLSGLLAARSFRKATFRHRKEEATGAAVMFDDTLQKEEGQEDDDDDDVLTVTRLKYILPEDQQEDEEQEEAEEDEDDEEEEHEEEQEEHEDDGEVQESENQDDTDEEEEEREDQDEENEEEGNEEEEEEQEEEEEEEHVHQDEENEEEQEGEEAEGGQEETSDGEGELNGITLIRKMKVDMLRRKSVNGCKSGLRREPKQRTRQQPKKKRRRFHFDLD